MQSRACWSGSRLFPKGRWRFTMASENSSSARILLVDDAPENLTVLAGALEPEGYEVLTTSSGPAALTIAERALPDLILLDVMMPEVDGLETCREIKRREKLAEIPVVFITARGD